MIRDVFKKVERLVRFNRVLRLKLTVCIVLLIAAGVQSRMLKDMDKTVARAEAEHELVMQVPAMEKELRTENLKLLKPERQIIAIKNILEGTSFRDDVYHAIIDGEVYSTGDMIGDYKIINITLRTIMLENSKIFEIKELSFPEPPGEPTEL
jgi:hypothetical protein